MAKGRRNPTTDKIQKAAAHHPAAMNLRRGRTITRQKKVASQAYREGGKESGDGTRTPTMHIKHVHIQESTGFGGDDQQCLFAWSC